MLASIFIVQGLDTVLHPDRKVAAAEPVVRPLAERVPFIPDDVEMSVRLSGAVQVVAGSLLAIGRFPRLSALAIAVDLVPTTYAGHRFWETDDKQERMQQRIHFLKNLSILGGLLIAAGDTAGNPSLAWRGRHAVDSAKHDAKLVAKSAKAQAKTAKVAAKTAKASAKTGAKTGAVAGRLSSMLPVG
jgi:putative oxidoreductase